MYERLYTDNGGLEVDNIFPSLIPAEDHYDKMVTWEEILPGQYIPNPEIGFHTVFGEVDPIMWSSISSSDGNTRFTGRSSY